MTTLVDGTGNLGAAPTVTGAVRNAAQNTGASFQYLLATAQVESGFNPNAMASTSSAGGLYQFIDQTWLGMLKEAGPSLGYGQFADAISKSPSGQYEVSDPSMRQEIMALRQNPTANAAMAGAFTQHNAASLAAQLGRAPSEGELYVAHFLGSPGAAKLISAAQTSPQANAAALFPTAAAANHSIFYDKQGAPRSVAEVYGQLVHRYDAARAGPASNSVALNSIPRPPADVPTTGGTATPTTSAGTPAPSGPSAGVFNAAAFAASQSTNPTPVFHSLFSSEEHRGGVSPVVQELWGTTGGSLVSDLQQPTPPVSGTAPSSASSKPSVVSLFSDQPTNVQPLFGNSSRPPG